jgi:hypothetical protein
MSLFGCYACSAAVYGCFFGQVALIRLLLLLGWSNVVIVGWEWVGVEAELSIHQFVLVSPAILLELGDIFQIALGVCESRGSLQLLF